MTHRSLPPEVVPIPDLDNPVVARATATGDRLVASRCIHCSDLAFPARTICRCCLRRDFTDQTLDSVGTLYAFTTVHTAATPYTIGYVDLQDGELRVFARITNVDRAALSAKVRLHSIDPITFAPEEEPHA